MAVGVGESAGVGVRESVTSLVVGKFFVDLLHCVLALFTNPLIKLEQVADESVAGDQHDSSYRSFAKILRPLVRTPTW